jgi:hypothetical protein
MDTDALIEALARDAAPVSPRAVERRLAAGTLAGSLAALAAVAALLGIRAGLPDSAFWMESAYGLSLAIIGLFLAAQLARPETRRPKGLWLPVLPVLALAALASGGLPGGGPEALPAGSGWGPVPPILALSAPVFAGLVWAFGRLAPTRLAAAGAAAGLASGGIAAALYALHGPPASAAYVLTRCSAAVALACASGALLGPRLLRW